MTAAIAAGGGLVAAVLLASAWRLFEKAGEPGWTALIPIHNAAVWMRVAGKPAWWVILLFIPVVNVLPIVLSAMNLARAFGRGAAFGVGLALLPPFFAPVLGFGRSTYQGA